jgi:hypothetical protein
MYESGTQDVPVFAFSQEGDIPPVSRDQLEQAMRWAITGLPHRVDMLPAGEAMIHLSSGEAVRITPTIRGEADAAHMDVLVHEIDQADVPEMMAIHKNLVQNTLFVARVMWARQQAAA